MAFCFVSLWALCWMNFNWNRWKIIIIIIISAIGLIGSKCAQTQANTHGHTSTCGGLCKCSEARHDRQRAQRARNCRSTHRRWIDMFYCYQFNGQHNLPSVRCMWRFDQFFLNWLNIVSLMGSWMRLLSYHSLTSTSPCAIIYLLVSKKMTSIEWSTAQ